MSRKKAYLYCLYTVLLLASVAMAAGVLLRHEPQFYRTRAIEPSAERKELSNKFVVDFAQAALNVKAGEPHWKFAVSDTEINSFLQEDFITRFATEVDSLRKLGISEPRVAFEDDCIRLAFRYGSGFWSTIVSYDLRVWAVTKEPNVLVVEIQGRRLGALPVSAQTLLDELAQLAANHNIEVTRYRYRGNPVAVIRFQPDLNRPTAQLKCLHVLQGELRVGGSCPGTAHAAAK
jgi:hypothetical protein